MKLIPILALLSFIIHVGAFAHSSCVIQTVKVDASKRPWLATYELRRGGEATPLVSNDLIRLKTTANELKAIGLCDDIIERPYKDNCYYAISEINRDGTAKFSFIAADSELYSSNKDLSKGFGEFINDIMKYEYQKKALDMNICSNFITKEYHCIAWPKYYLNFKNGHLEGSYSLEALEAEPPVRLDYLTYSDVQDLMKNPFWKSCSSLELRQDRGNIRIEQDESSYTIGFNANLSLVWGKGAYTRFSETRFDTIWELKRFVDKLVNKYSMDVSMFFDPNGSCKISMDSDGRMNIKSGSKQLFSGSIHFPVGIGSAYDKNPFIILNLLMQNNMCATFNAAGIYLDILELETNFIKVLANFPYSDATGFHKEESFIKMGQLLEYKDMGIPISISSHPCSIKVKFNDQNIILTVNEGTDNLELVLKDASNLSEYIAFVKKLVAPAQCTIN